MVILGSMKKWMLITLVLIVGAVGSVYISLSSTAEVFKTCEIMGLDDIEAINFSRHDSVLVAASTLYQGNPLKNFMQGEQYREAWSTPVKVPIVFLDTLMGGMKVIDEGGGKQTHSLKLRAKSGAIYTMRGINKDPKALVPDFARKLGLENIIVDGISAQHPYAALVVSKLAEKGGLLHTAPRAIFVPKQDILDKHNSKYGNRLFLLEHETEGGINWTPYKDVVEIMDTDDLQQLRMQHGKLVTIDRSALVRARLFDILIGDWDRHAKQWGWVVQKKNENYKAIPLPGDRDNAFFNIEGLIPTIIANKNLLPGLQAFDKEIDYLPGLVMPFDIYFLKNTSVDVFIKEAHFLQSALSDEVIDQAFKVWPERIYKLDAIDIIETLKVRRDNLVAYATNFSTLINGHEYLSEPLKGSEDKSSDEVAVACFECD